ncbi:hypothetical protein B0H13DRAFT_2431497 [Mycena leptocephala]|nr:hypothetical protein B0H13DRAFT_2431497 [Mycena leptocephala]
MIPNPRKRCKVEITLPDNAYLHKLLIQTLAAGTDEQGKVRALYGPVLVVTNPLKVAIHGSCLNAGRINASGGAVVYWGQNSHRNKTGRPWGKQTGPWAELLAALPTDTPNALEIEKVTAEIANDAGPPDEPVGKRDPASPILWNLFLANLVMMLDKDDIFLAAVRISLLAQADNILLLFILPSGLQVKLDTLEKWCARNFIRHFPTDNLPASTD